MLSLNQTKDESLNQSFLIQELEFQEYFLLNNNTIYKLEITKRKNEIIINYKKYSISFNNAEFEEITRLRYESIDKAYAHIINLFDEGKVKIKNINKKEMILILDKDKIELILTYSESNKNNNLINKLCTLKKFSTKNARVSPYKIFNKNWYI